MPDIITTGTSGYASGTIDTASTLVANVSPISVKHPNGLASAVIQMETILGSGTSLKGTLSNLVNRLAVILESTGLLKAGVTIPTPVISGNITGTYELRGTPTIPGAMKRGTSHGIVPYATSTTTSAAHNLAGTPDLLIWYLECTTANAGYAIGDRVSSLNDSSGRGFTVFANSTLVGYSTDASTPAVNDKSTHTSTAITAGSWKLVVVPYLMVT